MRRKGFTLVELLVVIAIIALLMGILMPALSRVRQLAFRLTCGTNLSGIGKAMLIYANDYEDELPRAGGRNAGWGALQNWAGLNRQAAFGPDNSSKATISSCFYLLVKYAEVTPKSFLCKGDSGTTEFKLADMTLPRPGFELIDAWDFGPSSTPAENVKHCSYSYHLPFGMYGLTVSSEPGFAVAADRNPWLKSPAADASTNWAQFIPDLPNFGNGTSEQAKNGNSISHQNEGQNVMFLDTHVEFEKRAFCSVENDNIYTPSGIATGGHPKGITATTVNVTLQSRKDSYLVHDPGDWVSRPTRP